MWYRTKHPCTKPSEDLYLFRSLSTITTFAEITKTTVEFLPTGRIITIEHRLPADEVFVGYLMGQWKSVFGYRLLYGSTKGL